MQYVFGTAFNKTLFISTYAAPGSSYNRIIPREVFPGGCISLNEKLEVRLVNGSVGPTRSQRTARGFFDVAQTVSDGRARNNGCNHQSMLLSAGGDLSMYQSPRD